MSRRKKQTLAISCFLLLALVVSYFIQAYITYRPRIQLVMRTLAMVNLALENYLTDHGRMPQDWNDMVGSGYLVPREAPIGDKADSYEKTGRLQLPKKYGTIVLYYLDDIVVNWGIKSADTVLRDNLLVNRNTGQETFVIGRRAIGTTKGIIFARDASSRLYNLMISTNKARGDSTNMAP